MSDPDLAARGDDIYKALIENREVSAAHKAMALNAARIADTLDRIEAELFANPNLTVINGQGTRTVNPLISEARMLTGALSTILAKMGISELPEVSEQGKTALDEIAERRAAKQRARDGDANPQDSLQPGG